jgi:hypothetical protein
MIGPTRIRQVQVPHPSQPRALIVRVL